jgi:hypothetical protein
MSREPNSSNLPLKGLLECPLHKGWIEFELVEGLTVRALKEEVQAKWGLPYPNEGDGDLVGHHVHHRERLFHPFAVQNSWLIAYQDKESAFYVLRDDDVIPTDAPSGEDVWNEVDVMEHFQERRGIPITPEAADLISAHIYAHHSMGGQPCRITKNFSRSYQIPKNAQYAVHLVAFVPLRGG